jgi:hypothetical protein
MATIKRVYEHFGAAWVDLMAIWSAHANDAAFSIGHSFSSVTFGSTDYLMISLGITTDAGSDTYEWVLSDSLANSGGPHLNLHYVASTPGFSTVPLYVSQDVGGRNNRDLARNQLWTLKYQYIENVTAMTMWLVDYVEIVLYDGSVRAQHNVASFYSKVGTGTVCQTFNFEGTSGDDDIPGKVNQYNPLQCGIAGSSTAGGAAVDTAPIVAAIEELALVDYDFAINNGADMFSMRGKVRT